MSPLIGEQMTSTLHQVRKSRGWSGPQLAHKLCVAAHQLGMTVASPNSLRVMISRWENGRSVPDSRALVLLQQVFDLPADALGFSQPSDIPESKTISVPGGKSIRASFSDEMLPYFTRQLEEHVRMDNAAGSIWVADAAAVQLGQLQKHSNNGSPEVNLMAARFAEFLGWLMHDSGQTEKGLRYTEQAIDFAEVAGDVSMGAYALMRKSNILTSLSERQKALAIARKAAQLAKTETPDLLPVCLRQVALSHAYCGDEHGFRQAFEHAIALTNPSIDRNNNLSSYCTTSYMEMEAALCWLVLRKPQNAVDACDRALATWPASLVRDESLCHARRATGYAELRQPEAACDAAHLAIERVQSAPSARTIHMLRLTTKRLEPFRHNSAVKGVTEALASVA